MYTYSANIENWAHFTRTWWHTFTRFSTENERSSWFATSMRLIRETCHRCEKNPHLTLFYVHIETSTHTLALIHTQMCCGPYILSFDLKSLENDAKRFIECSILWLKLNSCFALCDSLYFLLKLYSTNFSVFACVWVGLVFVIHKFSDFNGWMNFRMLNKCACNAFTHTNARARKSNSGTNKAKPSFVLCGF